MGSFMVRSVYLLSDGVLYRAELWDRDYEGDVWCYQTAAKDMPQFEFPLFITGKNLDQIVETIKRNPSWKAAVQDFCEQNIATYISLTEAADILHKDFFAKLKYLDRESFKEVPSVNTLCHILQIDDRFREYYLDNKRIAVICPLYILLEDDGKYQPLFLDEVNNLALSLDGTIIITKGSTVTQVHVEKKKGDHYVSIFDR